MLFGNSWYFSVWSLDTAGGFTWGFHLLKRFWSCWTWPFQQTMCWKTCCWWREHPAFYHCKFWRRYGTGCVKAPCAWQTSSRWHDGRLANFMTFFLGEAKLYSERFVHVSHSSFFGENFSNSSCELSGPLARLEKPCMNNGCKGCVCTRMVLRTILWKKRSR